MSLLTPNFKEDSVNRYVSWYLISSYIYYCRPWCQSPMTDEDFDKMCTVLLDNFDNITHPHKYLIDKESLKAGTGFNLKEEDYPLIVKHSAIVLYGR